MIVVSACLAGYRCRFDGTTRENPAIARLVAAGEAIPLCPEELGGLTTPRMPSEIQHGDGTDVLEGKARVRNLAGEDVTEAFLAGARETLAIARRVGATTAILKDGSPSCGSTRIRDGTFTNTRRSGLGVTSAMLLRNGIAPMSDESDTVPDPPP